MSAVPDHNCFIFVVDTETYAGNFEREMCAYMTGRIGECEVGDDIAAIVADEMPAKVTGWFENHIDQVLDDHGCSRPVSIWPTPGWSNDGNGGCLKEPGSYQAYLSVAVFLDAEPPEEVLSWMKTMALRFARGDDTRLKGYDRHQLTITGFRLLMRVVEDKEVSRWPV